MADFKSMDGLARHFWDGCAAGELRYQSCAACAALQWFARPFCVRCGAQSLHWQAAQGTGTVYAVTTVERAPTDEFRALAPYVIVLIDLDEGVRMMAHGVPGLEIGGKVKVEFFEHNGCKLPRFAPAGAGVTARRRSPP